MFSPDDGSRTSFRNVVSLFLQAIGFVCYCVFVCIYIGILAPLACFGLGVAVSLIATWGFFPWLLVFGCMWVCVCLGLYAILVFPGFNSCEVCSGWVICCHRCLTCFKGLCCVCTQVSGSVVRNWPLCEFWTCVLWFFWYTYFIPQFFETPDDG
jgi:hypothetical protein